MGWNALMLPPGFRMAARSAQIMPGSEGPVSHLVFTDGLASVSVFVESRPDGEPDQQAVVEESVRMGSSSVFSTVMGSRKVTAVGEVPLATVRSIASSFASQAPALTPANH
jgi:sigma-E factor negative regulatory protein RseB